MICYKVVHLSNSRRYYSTNTRYSIEYVLGQIALPHPELVNSKLFVFDTLENARIWAGWKYPFILKCKLVH